MSKKSSKPAPAQPNPPQLPLSTQPLYSTPPDQRPIMVLQLTSSNVRADIDEQQILAQKHLDPFGLRAIVIPRDMNFAGIIPPTT